MENHETIINPTLKANLMDSLQYLAELNIEIAKFKDKKIPEEKLFEFLLRRSKDFGYISDFRHTIKIMQQVNQIGTEK